MSHYDSVFQKLEKYATDDEHLDRIKEARKIYGEISGPDAENHAFKAFFALSVLLDEVRSLQRYIHEIEKGLGTAVRQALMQDNSPPLRTPGEWISVDERMPPENKSILVWAEESCAFITAWDAKKGWAFLSDYSITHWMPLPEGPKKESEKGGREMTDQELLEMAAKAAGLKILRDPNGVLRDCTADKNPARNIYSFPVWNPLTDDGDAFRLAAKLRLDISQGQTRVRCGLVQMKATELILFDRASTMRRAIVRAAAEIGKTKGGKP